ncbi:MAG: MBL fold metallo-hydrolase [Bacteroidales bacterium]
MNRTSRLAVLILFLVLPAISARGPEDQTSGSAEPSIHLTIIYDNYISDPSLRPDWGFACLVEVQGNKLLFDTGREASIFRKNMESLGIQPSVLPSLFISHEHGDHTGGMAWVLKENPSIHCYLPASYEQQLQSRDQLPDNHQGIYEPAHMYGPFYSTGDHFEAFREQGLVIKTDKGGVLITGCGHPGIVEMVTAAEQKLGIEVVAVVGGLHLMNTGQAELDQIAEKLKALGVKQICPTHCTGDQSIARLKASFGAGYVEGGTGKKITLL